MVTLWVAAVLALWWGILTSVHPCPLAGNVVAVSYIARRVGRRRQVVLAGLVYTLARAATYLVLGALLVSGALARPDVAEFLRRYLNRVIGPVLILLGMFLLGLIRFRTSGVTVSDRMQQRVDRWGLFGAALLGIVLALAFCPVSAAYFFTSLITLALDHGSRFLLPALYGVGTALPVALFAVLAAVSAQSVGKVFNRVTQVERWVRRITGVVFILAGIFYCLTFIFEVQWFEVLSSH